MKKKYRKGQGLVEFALILPILLLVIVGTIEFARIFLIYANVSNAAREGSRFGMVNPTDQIGIESRSRDTLLWTVPGSVIVDVFYDSGPGTGVFDDTDDVTVGNRVVVNVKYPVNALTPIFEPFVPSDFVIEVENARTVQSLKPIWTTPSLAPGVTYTFTPEASLTPTEDALTSTPVNTPDPGATATNTPPATLTNTPEPLDPIVITKPLWAGTTEVGGTAEPNQMLTLRIVQTGYQITGQVDASGNFNFNVWPVLVGGHTVIVQGYGEQDLAVVQAVTPTPTIEATPTSPYIRVSPMCTNDQSAEIHVTWGNWSPPASTMYIYWDNDTTARCSGGINAGTVGCTFNAFVTTGMVHTITGIARKSNGQEVGRDTVTFERPCPDEPTPTPSTLADLQITGLTLLDTPPLGTYDTLYFQVGVHNAGQTDVASLFWVDLYADSTGVLTSNASIDYVAINAIAAGSTVSFTMYAPGFDHVGVYTLQAMVDTWDQIAETDETNNVSAALPITVTVDNPPPPPTPVVTPGPTGSIDGVTYLDNVRQPNVSVYVYDVDGRLWGSGRSLPDPPGYYEITNLPAGSYVVKGQLRLADIFYLGQVGPVNVAASQTTVGVDIDLVEVE